MTDSTAPHGFVSLYRHASVLVVTINDAKANALSSRVSAEVSDAIGVAEADPDLRAVVIAGREGVFSAGFDLGVFRSGEPDAIAAMINDGGALIARMYGSSVPIVAACTGHAMAAGALLLLGCDHRVGPDADVKVGLNEVAIGLVLPDWALVIARERLSPTHLQRAVTNARIHGASEAVVAGFLDEIVEPERVIDTAIERASELSRLDPGAYAATVSALRRPVVEAMAAAIG